MQRFAKLVLGQPGGAQRSTWLTAPAVVLGQNAIGARRLVVEVGVCNRQDGVINNRPILDCETKCPIY
jgi:hypothetical protein